MTRKLFRTLHLWLSLPVGLIISAICFSGAMLVFEREITEILHNDLYFVSPAEKPLPLDLLLQNCQKELPDSVAIVGVAISQNPRRAYQVNLSKPHRASLFVDQYTGEVKGRSERIAFFDTMSRLHSKLLAPTKSKGSKTGKLVVGITTLLMVFILVSGIIVWTPRSIKGLKKSLKIEVRKGWRRLWYSLHIAGGVYTACILLVMALTGLTWSFSWYRQGVYALFGINAEGDRGSRHGIKEGAKETPPKKEKRESSSDFTHWQAVLDELATTHSTYKQITINNGLARISYDGIGNQRASDNYIFDDSNGTILSVQPYDEQPAVGKLQGWIMSLHVGNWGGILTRILAFFGALLGATLPLTGYYMWIVRKLPRWRKKGFRRQRAI